MKFEGVYSAVTNMNSEQSRSERSERSMDESNSTLANKHGLEGGKQWKNTNQWDQLEQINTEITKYAINVTMLNKSHHEIPSRYLVPSNHEVKMCSLLYP